jgi:signal peptidase complex subunit 1
MVQILAFCVGYLTGNVYNCLYTGLGGTALTFVVCVPHWPFYNQNPARFLPSQKYKGTINVSVDVDGKKVS